MITYINTWEEKARGVLEECGAIADSPDRILKDDLRRVIKWLQTLIDTPADGAESFIFWGYYTPAGEFPQPVFFQGERFFIRDDAGEFQQITDKTILDRIKDISFGDHRREAGNK